MPRSAEVIGLMLGDGCISRARKDGEPIATLTMGAELERPIVAEVRDRLNRWRAGSEDGRAGRPIEVGAGRPRRPSPGSPPARDRVAEIFERYAVLDGARPASG